MAVGEVVALVFGNERRGVSPGLLEAADASFYLPMAGFTQSFNISVPARHLTAAPPPPHCCLTAASSSSTLLLRSHVLSTQP